MRRLLIAFLFVPVVALGDFTGKNDDQTVEFTVYDESIKLVNIEESIVSFYTRTKYIRKNSKPDAILQSVYNCKTKYSAFRFDEKDEFSNLEWTIPDSVGRARGEYACSYVIAILKKAEESRLKLFPELSEQPKKAEQLRQPERYEQEPISCKTFLDCPAGQDCQKYNGASVCQKIDTEYRF